MARLISASVFARGAGKGDENEASISDALESLSDMERDEMKEDGDRASGERS